jgi:hypothetical protein
MQGSRSATGNGGRARWRVDGVELGGDRSPVIGQAAIAHGAGTAGGMDMRP